MRHRSTNKKFNRDTKSRKALFKNLVRSLVETGSIVTTESKAKEAKRIADKLIGKAKTDSLVTRRTLHRFFGVRDVVNTLVERVAPEFSDRVSGFTRVTKIGVRRGDTAQMAQLTLVKIPEGIGSLKKTAGSTKTGTKKTAAQKATAKKAVTQKVAVAKTVAPTKSAVTKTVRSKAVKKESK